MLSDWELTPLVRSQRRDLLADLDPMPSGGEDRPDPRHQGLRVVGVTQHPSSKDVWVRLAVPAQWAHRGACSCGEQTQGARGRSH